MTPYRPLCENPSQRRRVLFHTRTDLSDLSDLSGWSAAAT